MPESSINLAARDIESVLHPYTNLVRHQECGPLVIDTAEGVWIVDDRGNRYLDGMAGLWCVSLGYGEQRLVDAATRQLEMLSFSHTFNSRSNQPVIELAERLIELAPAPMAKVFFASSGSEANDTAVKLVWYYNNAIGRPRKKKIIARNQAYHGVTVAAASLTGLAFTHTDFDLPIENILHTECPHFFRFGREGESESEYASRLARELDDLIEREGPETVAAFIAEPIMGGGGVLLPPETYFEKVQAVLKKHDVLLLVDEVICGFGRTGSMFGSQTFGLQPDIAVVAKGLSSGYLPISAVMVNEAISSAIVKNTGKVGTFGHGFTYSGHPVPCAVALEALNIYRDRDILGQVNEVSPHLQNGLQKFADYPLVGEVRGVGLIAAVELVANAKPRGWFDPEIGVAKHLVARAQDHGAILRAMPGDSVAFSPPLIISKEEVEVLLERFELALNETVQWVNAGGRDVQRK